MNALECGNCAHYDPILGPKGKNIKKGWCIKRSKYPYRDGPGQLFPANAVRVDSATKLAEPYIVREKQVVEACGDAQQSRTDPVIVKKAQTERVMVTMDKRGRRVIK